MTVSTADTPTAKQRPQGSTSTPTTVSRRRFSVFAQYGYVLPLLIWLLITIGIPLLIALHMSLFDVGVIGESGSFVGLDNYRVVLASGEFWEAARRSVVWVVANAVLQTFAAFSAALFLRVKIHGTDLVRTWVIVPWVIPTVVVVVIWRWMLLASGGIVNYVLSLVHLIDQPVAFFGSGNAAFGSLVIINSWRWFPFLTVIILAGLLQIPEEQYEAAAVDGANQRQQMWYITLPGLQPVLFLLGLVGTLLSFNVFDIIWLMTAGGPGSSTETLPVLIYEVAFKRYEISQAAAMSVVMGTLLMALAVVFIKFMAPPIDMEEQ